MLVDVLGIDEMHLAYMVSTEVVDGRRMAGTIDATTPEGRCIAAVAVLTMQTALRVMFGVSDPAFPRSAVA